MASLGYQPPLFPELEDEISVPWARIGTGEREVKTVNLLKGFFSLSAFVMCLHLNGHNFFKYDQISMLHIVGKLRN